MTQIPSIQHATQVIGREEFVVNPAKPVDPIGPTQIMLEVEAYGICFSDTKLLHQLDSYPRKSDVVAGIGLDALKDIPSYHPNQEAVTSGHEPVVCVVQVDEEVTHFRVGDRPLVQVDRKHLHIAKSNGAFGYNFDGALEEYVAVDERCVVSPDGGELLIHVPEGPSAAAVGLIEPWTTVEGSYVWAEHSHVVDGGHLLVVGEGDIDVLTAEHKPAEAVCAAVDVIEGVEGKLDDIVFFGADADAIEKVASLIGAHGTMCVVLGGEEIPCKVSLDIGRVHYDFTRLCGTTGSDPRESYAWIPANGDLREDDRCVFVGTAGPMSVMYTMRAVISGVSGLSVVDIDLSGERLENLTKVVGPIAEKNGVLPDIANTSSAPLEYGHTCATCLVSAPAPVSQAVNLLVEGGIPNAFAGIPAGTFGDFDLQGTIERQIFMLGIPSSDVSDMRTVLCKIEVGIIDTTISLQVTTGMAGFGDAINAVMDRTSGGKIMIFPMTCDLSLIPVSELAEKPSAVAVKFDVAGLWTKEAEGVLLATH